MRLTVDKSSLINHHSVSSPPMVVATSIIVTCRQLLDKHKNRLFDLFGGLSWSSCSLATSVRNFHYSSERHPLPALRAASWPWGEAFVPPEAVGHRHLHVVMQFMWECCSIHLAICSTQGWITSPYIVYRYKNPGISIDKYIYIYMCS